MPLRLKALPPGEFIRNQMVKSGGIDYPQNVYREYKAHLISQGMKEPCRATMSAYFWRAHRMGLIVFDHAEAQDWSGNGAAVSPGYQRESRPQAPSPRHYYRIVDPTDQQWIRLNTSYRKFLGQEVPPPRVPAPVIEKPKVEKKPPPAKKPAKKVEKPKVEKLGKRPEAQAKILALLDDLERAPSMDLIDQLETALLDDRFLRALESIGSLRNSLSLTETEKLATRRALAQKSFKASLRVIREDVMAEKVREEVPVTAEVVPEEAIPVTEEAVPEEAVPLTAEEEEEEAAKAAERVKLVALQEKWLSAARNTLYLEKDLAKLDSDLIFLSDVDNAIEAYREIERGDYDDAEAYSDARSEAWEEIQLTIEALHVEGDEVYEDDDEEEEEGPPTSVDRWRRVYSTRFNPLQPRSNPVNLQTD